MNDRNVFTIAVLREPEYSHKEALAILGISQDTLMSWYKRDLVPLPQQENPGRGHRRKYSVQDLLTLQMMKLVTPYVGQAFNTLVAHDCADILVKHYWPSLPQDPYAEEFPDAYLVLARGKLVFTVNLVEAGQLELCLRNLGAQIELVINVRAVLIALLSQIFGVLVVRQAQASEKRRA